MKKLLAIAAILIFTCCTHAPNKHGNTQEQPQLKETFVNIESGILGVGCRYYIFYDVDTKVEYILTWNSSALSITPMYNSDGTLKLYYE